MTFEEWWEDYIFSDKHELTTKDLKASYEAGWNACIDGLVDDLEPQRWVERTVEDLLGSKYA